MKLLLIWKFHYLYLNDKWISVMYVFRPSDTRRCMSKSNSQENEIIKMLRIIISKVKTVTEYSLGLGFLGQFFLLFKNQEAQSCSLDQFCRAGILVLVFFGA